MTSNLADTTAPTGRAVTAWPLWSLWSLWPLWPIGFLFAGLQAGAHLLPTAPFLVLDACYVALAFVAVRHAMTGRLGARAAAGAAVPLVGASVAILALASLTGIPTAEHPAAMLANAAVLLGAAILVLVGAVLVATQVWDGPGRAPAALALTALSVGSAGYLANLLARAGVALSGASPQQASIEGTAWQANHYLTGLPGQPSALATLLVCLDLIQLAYIVLAYLAGAGLAAALARAGMLPARLAKATSRTGLGLALVTTASIALAMTGAFDTGLPAAAADAAAMAAYGLTAPFASTLLPFIIGAGLLTSPNAVRGRGRGRATIPARRNGVDDGPRSAERR